MNKIPVYLLNGTLGSGKTTLLRELLRKNAQKQFVIENEIANTSVDDVLLPQIAELEADVIFMDSWQAQEYYRHEGEVAKWQRQT